MITDGSFQAAANNPVAQFNRITTDGAIANFRKENGTTVGSIGETNGGNLIVQGSTATGKSGIKFGGSEWIPQDNGNSDGAVDLGLRAQLASKTLIFQLMYMQML